MTTNALKRFGPYFKPGIAGLLAGFIVFYGFAHFRAMQLDDVLRHEQGAAKDRLNLVAQVLSQSLNTRLHHTRSLVAFVKANPNFNEREFMIYANALQENLKGLRSLQLAPKGVIRYVTNLEQNRAAMGHDLFADPKRRALVEQAVKDRRYVIAGPIKLIQGGTAIIARRPIFLPNPAGSGDTFWGFATVLIDVAPLLAESGFLNLRQDMALTIRGKDGLGAKGDFFYGSAETAARAFATANVILPTGSWQISAADSRRYADSSLFNSFWYWVVAWIATSIFSAVVYLMVDYPLRLQNAVRTTTRDLRAAKETAEAANKAKTEFLATVSHELRTPLTAIKGALGLIDGKVLGDVPAKLSETIGIALKNSDHLSVLIDDILDVAKIEAGTMEYKMKPLAVSSLIENAVVANRPFAEQCGTSIVVKELLQSVWIEGDEHRLMQVLANLLSNAVKFSVRGSVVELSASRRGDKIRIAVTDFGCGIPEGFKAKIFERFSQVDSSDSRNVGGTGLGLSIVKDIIDHHPGAAISVVSELAKGSTVAVEFPEHVAEKKWLRSALPAG